MQKPHADARKIFRAHRSTAETRGIPFRLTFNEWWSVWAPYWPAKLLGAPLHMCRTGDAGAYEIGNVRIDTQAGNNKERALAQFRRKTYVLKMPSGKALPDRVGRLEVRILRKALAATNWNMTAAAQRLGVSFRAIRYMLAKYSGRIGRYATSADNVRANSDLDLIGN